MREYDAFSFDVFQHCFGTNAFLKNSNREVLPYKISKYSRKTLKCDIDIRTDKYINVTEQGAYKQLCVYEK